MKRIKKTPRYAVRLVILFVCALILFFGGLRLFVPDGSKLTGSYDAKSLLYIAAAPVSYQGAASCGTVGCHAALFKKWSEGAHGARKEQSKCEVCHGPQGNHPDKSTKLPRVRGNGDLVELCLNCHRKMHARSTTGQPQISPQEHPYPHQGVLLCTQCHDPHAPGIGLPKSSATATTPADGNNKKNSTRDIPASAAKCAACHGQSGRGGFAPVLAGQPYRALKTKLMNFKSGKTTSAIMNPLAAELHEKDIAALARYFARL